jgi:UV DNA damage endonuclease
VPLLPDPPHHPVLPSDPRLSTEALFELAAPTWHALGLRPKYHLASQRPGARPGAHDEGIHADDWREVAAALHHPADLMLEAKGKDLALFALRSLGVVERGRAGASPASPAGA